MAETYRKLVCRQYTRDYRASGEVIEAPVVAPEAGQVLAQNKFGGVNASDVNISGGVYFSDGVFPFDLGCESTGEVLDVGDGVEEFGQDTFDACVDNVAVRGRILICANLKLVQSGAVDPLIDKTKFQGVDQAVDAVEFLHSGKNIGKVIVQY